MLWQKVTDMFLTVATIVLNVTKLCQHNSLICKNILMDIKFMNF